MWCRRRANMSNSLVSATTAPSRGADTRDYPRRSRRMGLPAGTGAQFALVYRLLGQDERRDLHRGQAIAKRHWRHLSLMPIGIHHDRPLRHLATALRSNYLSTVPYLPSETSLLGVRVPLHSLAVP